MERKIASSNTQNAPTPSEPGMTNEGGLKYNIGAKSASRVLTALITTVTVTRIISMSLGSVSGGLGNSVWYMLILSAIWGAAFFALSCLLMTNYKNSSPGSSLRGSHNGSHSGSFDGSPGNPLGGALKNALGKFGGGIVLAFFGFIFLLDAMYGVRVMTESLNAYILNDTPGWVLCVVIVVAAGICCFRGIEHTARLSYAVRVPLLLMLASVLIIANRNFNYLFPIGGYGINITFLASFSVAGAFMPVVGVWFLPVEFGDGVKIGFKSIIYSAVIGVVVLLGFTAASPFSAVREATPVGELIALVSAKGNVLPVVYIFMWGAAYLFTIVYSLHFSAHALSDSLGRKYSLDVKQLLPPLCVILGILAIFFDWPALFRPASSLLSVRWILYLIPVVLALAASLLKKLFKKGTGNEKN